MRRIITAVGALVLSGALVASVGAGTITGTTGNDNLHGTPGPDRITGGSGNDHIAGLTGNDYLSGGPGNDVLVGGPGADTVLCGSGRDTVVADAADTKIAADCETIQGLPKPALSVTGGTQAEGNSGVQPMSFTVTLAKASPLKVSVAYATTDGTATAGSDYSTASGTLVFAPGQKTKTVTVPIVGDTVFEPDEAFTLTLSSPVNATTATATATGTITNDDAAKAKPGHYHGQIGNGGFVDFDVSPDAGTVSNLVIMPYMTCDPASGSGVYTFRFGDTSPIQPDLTFAANGSGTGVSVTFQGKFNTDVNLAAGTLNIHLAYDDSGGTHNECNTGTVPWAAAWKG